jgi:acyl carrier protein
MKLEKVVISVIKDLGTELKNASFENPSLETRIFGSDGLDSMALVTLIADLEEKLGDMLGKPVVLADERAMSRFHSPFRTVGTLVAHVQRIAGEISKNE